MRVFILCALLMLCLPLSVDAVDEASYNVVLKDRKFEIRQYNSMLVAEVTVTGNMRRAGNRGFRLLADFIFGNNKPAENIAMTSPVTSTKSTKIDMTAPVTRVENTDNSWVVAFVMPTKWTKENLPQPNNPEVIIRDVAPELIASIRFSGRGSAASHAKKYVLLAQWVNEKGYKAVGQPRYAGYDAPWVPWPMRRNEVMVPVAIKGSDTN